MFEASMVLLSKPLSEEAKENAYKQICAMGVLGVTMQNVVMMAEAELITACVGRDPAKAAAAMAFTSSASGLVEFVANPVLGKLVDKYGRKFLFYLGPLVSGVGMNLAVLLTGGKNLNLMLGFRALNWSLISISNSFIGPISMSDMFSGQELGIRMAKFFGAFGIPVVLSPGIGNLVSSLTGSALGAFKLRLLIGFVQLAHVRFNIPETLTADKQRGFVLSDANPLAFLKLFSRSSTKTLRTLVAFLFCSMLAEGKNMLPLYLTWMTSQPLFWSDKAKTAVTTLYGTLMVGSGVLAAPKLIKALGPRGFTSLANCLNLLGFTVQGFPLPTFDIAYCLGYVIHAIGINNTNASAVKAMATDHAVASGYGKGEYGGMASSLRSLALIVAPFMYNWAYRPIKGAQSKKPPGFPFLMAALFAAALPELLHRSLSDEDLRVPTQQIAKEDVSKSKS